MGFFGGGVVVFAARQDDIHGRVPEAAWPTVSAVALDFVDRLLVLARRAPKCIALFFRLKRSRLLQGLMTSFSVGVPLTPPK